MDILKRVRRNLGAEPAPEASAAAEIPSAGTSSSFEPASEQESAGAGVPDDRWVGYIDHIDRTVITGWCYDSRNLQRSVPVEVIASNGKRVAAIAGIFRQDVKDAGYGSGQYGFEIDVASLGLKDETLTVRFAESKIAINKVPFSLDPQRALLEGKLPESYTSAMQVLAVEAHAKFADLENHGKIR